MKLVALGEGARVRRSKRVLTLAADRVGDGVELRVIHAFRPEKVWLPHLAPTRDHVIGDRVFRSPAILLVQPRRLLAFVADVDDVARAPCRTWLDYDAPKRTVALGAGDYRIDSHVLFARKKPAAPIDAAISLRLHLLASERPRDLANPYGMVARWLWRRWGRAGLRRGGSQSAPLDRYLEWIHRWAFGRDGWQEALWQSFELDGRPAGAPAFIVDVAQHPSLPPAERRWREQKSVWNQAWFSTQRCANGMLRHARHIGSADLERRARLATAVALAAPQTDGLFPAVLTCGEQPMYTLESATPPWSEARWTNSDRRPPSASADACHLCDAAHTARMLLDWHALSGDERARAYAVRLADRLVRLQRRSGAFPGWVEPDGRVARDLAESCESAVSVSLLFELGGRFTPAALAGLPFLARRAARSAWEEFETYYSCCPMGAPGRRYRRSALGKHGTLAIFWCAEAFLAAYRATRARRWLDLARRAADELSLYQAVWDPPFLPAPAHGGFGVMNADSEWNDARQSVFAPFYLELYRATGDAELFERGVSALRAAFTMMYCPENPAVRAAYQRRFPFFGPESYGFMMENQGHGDGDPIGPFTIFSWGNGSALAAAALVRERFGQVYLDRPRRRAFGIDGCHAELRGGRLRVEDFFARDSLVAVNERGERRLVRLRG